MLARNPRVRTRFRVGLLCALAGAAMAAGPDQAMVGKVMTVNGPIAATALGTTMPHEHVLMDSRLPNEAPLTWQASGRKRPETEAQQKLYRAPLEMKHIGTVAMGSDNRDNWLLNDEQIAIKELKEYRYFGGRSVVDLTNDGLKRDPKALKRISQASGVNIVMGSGWYQRAWLGEKLKDLSVAALAQRLVRDIQVGVEGTGIRAGIIGELSPLDPKGAYDRKILQAAARASRQTGAPISLDIPLHTAAPESVLDALDILQTAGADLTRVAVGHANVIALNMPLMQQLLQKGVYLQFDRLGDFPHVFTLVTDHDVAVSVLELMKQGHGKQILMSQGVCAKIDLKAYGGSSYVFLLEQYIPYIKRMGFTDAQIQQITVDNPQRLLAFAAPQEG